MYALIHLLFKVKPKWIKDIKDIKIKSGDNIEIECKADGEPKPVIKWIDSKGLYFEKNCING